MLSACRPRAYTFSEWVLFLVYMAGLKCEPNLYVYEYMVEVYMIKDPVGHSRPLLLALFYDIPACSQTSYRLSEFIIFCVYDGNILLYIHIYMRTDMECCKRQRELLSINNVLLKRAYIHKHHIYLYTYTINLYLYNTVCDGRLKST